MHTASVSRSEAKRRVVNVKTFSSKDLRRRSSTNDVAAGRLTLKRCPKMRARGGDGEEDGGEDLR